MSSCSLNRAPYALLAVAHLVNVAVLPAILQMEFGGFQRSGGVLGWSAVSPFTAVVIYQDMRKVAVYIVLFVVCVAAAFIHEAYCRGQGQAGKALFSDRVIKVYTFQLYIHAVLTLLGTTFNALVLMSLLR